jgi:hypothetical protein
VTAGGGTNVAIKENFVKSFIVSYILVWKEVSVKEQNEGSHDTNCSAVYGMHGNRTPDAVHPGRCFYDIL